MSRILARLIRSAAWCVLVLLAPHVQAGPDAIDRSPVDLALTADEAWLVTANQTSDSVSLVRVSTGEVVAERSCGRRPSAVVLTPDERRVLVSATYDGELVVFERDEAELRPLARIYLGFEPRGIAVSPDGQTAYVALTTAHEVAVVDLGELKVVDRIPVAHWPRYLAISPDGSRLAVGTSGDRGMTIVDTHQRKALFTNSFKGINLGEVQISRDGKHAYVPWMIYRQNPITPGNIRLGWVLASRIARIRMDENAQREAIALDKSGEAVSDPHGLAISPDEQWMVCSASGTHELLVFKLPGLEFRDYGGPGDHIDARLLHDAFRFFRIPVGGRPMAVRFAKDGRRVFVANYLLNAVQVADLESRDVVRTISLGGPEQPSLARLGETIFYDGKRSLDQWYSCHSCHYEGHTNAVAMDTRNDGADKTFKTVLSLRNVTRTGPWTWHGWQKDLRAAMHKSLTDTMLGPAPTDDDVTALIAFLETLQAPPHPARGRDAALSEAAQRGREVFVSAKAGCANCHAGEFFTDDEVHEVGLESPNDKYVGFNPPSLLGTYDRVQYLHDGRAKTLEELLRGPHNPAQVTGTGELSEPELRDLVVYLKTL